MKERELYGVTSRVILLSIVILAIFLPISEIILFYNNKPATFFGWPLTTFWLIIIFYALGKLNRLFKLTPAEFAMLTIIVNFIAGSRGVAWWVHTENILRLIDLNFGVIPLSLHTFPEWNEWVPDVLYPKQERSTITRMIINGISPGEAFPWSTLIPSLMVWSIFAILLMFISMFVVFGFIGQPWVERENVQFPSFGQPPIYLIKHGTEGGEEPSIFSTKTTESKVFWVFFLIGLSGGIIPLILEIFPALPLLSSFQFGWFYVPLLSFLPSVLPGALAGGWFGWSMFYVGLIVPNEILFTSVIGLIVIDIIWNAVGLSAGLYVSYTPGAELGGWPYPGLPYGQAPFPIGIMSPEGMAIGVGLLLFWSCRDRFRLLFSTMRGKDQVEEGLSLRFLGYFGIASFIITWILMSALGIPWLIALEWLILFILVHTYMARIASEYYDICWGLNQVDWKVMYPTGAALGYWSATPPANQSWFITRSLTMGQAFWIQRCGGFYGIIGLAPLYKMMREFKVNLKHVLYLLILFAVIGTPLVYITGYYIMIHGGGFLKTNLYNWPQYSVGGSGVSSVDFGIPGADWPLQIQWIFIGLGIAILFYVIKMVFPVIPINPYMLVAVIGLNVWMWVMALASLIVKLVATRIVGAQTYIKYALPVAVGAISGYGAVFAVTSFVNLFQVCLPTVSSLWVP